MVSCLLVATLISFLDKTMNPRVIAPISIGATLLSHTGILLFSMKIGVQYLTTSSSMNCHHHLETHSSTNYQILQQNDCNSSLLQYGLEIGFGYTDTHHHRYQSDQMSLDID